LIAMWFAGYDPYSTPFYGRNFGLAILICFFVLVVFIAAVNFIGFLIGQGSRARSAQTRAAQI